jgi:hypothetical protein
MECISEKKAGRPRALKEPGRRYMRRYSKRAARTEPDYPCSPKLLEKLFVEIAQGRLLREIAREKWSPSVRTVMYWCRDWPKVAEMYSLAKRIRLEVLEDAILDIADGGDPERAKHQIRAREHLHSRLARWADTD